MLLAVIGACGDSARSSDSSPPATSPNVESTSTAAPKTTLPRSGVANGCPKTLQLAVGRRDLWIDNSSIAGLGDSLVPGSVSAGQICRYNALNELGNGADLFAGNALDSDEARALAARLNSIPFTPNSGSAGCILTQTERERITVIAFSVGLPMDVDIWYIDDGGVCDTFSNGVRTGDVSPELTAAVTMLDEAAPQAPVACMHGSPSGQVCP